MNSRDLIQILLGEFYDKLKLLKEILPREVKFPKVPNKIKAAVGIRRSGKTFFLFHYMQQLLDQGVDKNCLLYLNFEDDRIFPLTQKKFANLVEAFYSLYPENHERKCYLFFDEIQNVENWPLVIRRLHDTKQAEIFLTGSSAKLLSKEIATSLRGRSLATEIWPFSFEEFMNAKKISINRTLFDKKTQDNLEKAFYSYLSEGGFPEIISYDWDSKQRTLQDYLDVVIFRDIIERYNIKNGALIKYMILSMIHNVGKPFAINKFFNDLKSQGFHISKDILYEYADHIEDAYLAFQVPLYSKSIRRVQTNPKKLYAIDSGLIRALTFDYEGDLGRLFENIVYLDLRRHDYKIFYYLTKERYEIDFLVQNRKGQKKFFQVVWDHENSETLLREKRALDAGMKELKIEGEILTLASYLQNGISF